MLQPFSPRPPSLAILVPYTRPLYYNVPLTLFAFASHATHL